MQEVPTTFVRVFDIERSRAPLLQRGGTDRTSFSFEDQEGNTHRTSICGVPRISNGMSVVAVLAPPVPI